MVGMLTNIKHTDNKTISNQDYEIFRKEYIFDQLKGLKYGKAFCERFAINDPVVSRLIDEDLARELIEETYIK
jgi:hypothetical protein